MRCLLPTHRLTRRQRPPHFRDTSSREGIQRGQVLAEKLAPQVGRAVATRALPQVHADVEPLWAESRRLRRQPPRDAFGYGFAARAAQDDRRIWHARA